MNFDYEVHSLTMALHVHKHEKGLTQRVKSAENAFCEHKYKLLHAGVITKGQGFLAEQVMSTRCILGEHDEQHTILMHS